MAEISLNSRLSVDGGDFDLSRVAGQQRCVGGGPRHTGGGWPQKVLLRRRRRRYTRAADGARRQAERHFRLGLDACFGSS